MIRILSKSVRDNKTISIIVPILVIYTSLVRSIIPFLMANIIDIGIMRKNIAYIMQLGIILLLLSVSSIIIGCISSWLSGKAAAGFSRNLRHDLFYHVQKFSLSNIDKISNASLVTRLTTDTNNLQSAYQGMLRIAVRAPSVLIFSSLMSYEVSPKMSLLFIITLPILILGLFFIIKNARPLFKKVFSCYDILNRIIREDLRGIRIVKSYAREDLEDRKFNVAANNIYNTFSKAQKLMALNAPLMKFTVDLTMLLLCWFGAKNIINGQLQDGQLISMFSYTMQILMSLNMLSMIFGQLTVAEASARRITKILQIDPKILNSKNGIKVLDNGNISFNKVYFRYDNEQKFQLNNICLNINAGNTLGIVGRNGSGKSTLVSLIPRLYDVSSGSITINDQNIKYYDLNILRKNIAVVPQTNILFAGTIKDNLKWGNFYATDDQIIKACKISQADEFIRRLPNSYNTNINQNGVNISGGQIQRICIARALLKKPKILILDEATSAIDNDTEIKIRNSLYEILNKTTKIIISQKIASVQYADNIIILDNGKIVGHGTHNELLNNNSFYRELYNDQNYEGSVIFD